MPLALLIGQQAGKAQRRDLGGRCELDTGMLMDSRKVELTRNPSFECGKQGLLPEVMLLRGLSVACRGLDISRFADCNGQQHQAARE
jgi:hypothetical protein